MRRLLAAALGVAVVSGCTGAERAEPAATADTEASTVRLAVETDDEAGVVTAIESTDDGFVAAGAIMGADQVRLEPGGPGVFNLTDVAVWRAQGDSWQRVALAPLDRDLAPFPGVDVALVRHVAEGRQVLVAGGVTTDIKDVLVWRSEEGRLWGRAPGQDTLVGNGFEEMVSGPLLVALQGRQQPLAPDSNQWQVRFSPDGNVWHRNRAGPYRGRVISAVGSDDGFLVSTDVGIYASTTGREWTLLPDQPASAVLASDGKTTAMAVVDDERLVVLQGSTRLADVEAVGEPLPAGAVAALAVEGDRILIVAHDFERVAQISAWLWDGIEWHQVVDEMPGQVATVEPAGEGFWLLGGSDANGPAVWRLDP